jgi:cell division initiation protein
MDLSARDIHEKQFHDSWRGYNQEEVDEFLDRVADVLDRLQRENSALNARVTELDHAVATSRDTEEMLKKTLITAQQAAEEAIASAKAKAEALIQEAEERTRRVHREADEKLQSADAEARRKSLEADREHTIRKREIDASLEKLRRFESDLKRRLAAFLGDQTRALERLTEDEPPRLEPPQPRQEPVAEEPAVAEAIVEATSTPDEGADAMSDLAADETEGTEAESDAQGAPSDDDEQEAGFERPFDSTAQWIPDFVASREAAGEAEPEVQANGSGVPEETEGVQPSDIRALYSTGELTALENERVHSDEPAAEGAAETVNLAEEETTSARQRSRSLFWRNDS